MLKKIYPLLVIVLVLSSCTIEPEEFDAKQGAADFSTTVFIGNSLTAGFSSGELYKSAQEESFPAIIAQSMNQAGFINQFKQPLMPGETGFGNRLTLGYSTNCEGVTDLGPVPYSDEPDISPAMASVASEGPFQNLGVPGAKVADLITPGYGSSAGNPYFARFTSDPMNTILQEATAQNPTFSVVWIGNNDVLGYATSGGTGTPITDPVTFAANLETVVQSLSTDGANGVLCNIPDVTSTAYFTTVPYYGLVLDADQAHALMESYEGYNQLAEANDLDPMSFNIGPNSFIIEDKDPTYDPVGNIRQIDPGELIALEIPLDSVTCYGMGSATPIPDEYVLTSTELEDINSAIAAYNNSIADIANTYDWAVTDVNGLLADIAQNGRRIGGKSYSIDFVTGGLFSLDGIHLTGNGNAIVANKIIETINLHFDAALPKAMVNNYTGIIYP
ncbi:GDSL-like Lipase/Acylhydrolase [Salinivirga cyanobacteriivorans]|uniref:GDSL-like Lipase/Acylhydrolase n=1 Tax=Salinivirga cyanobacteriivorans TaxID=1307839 RepID=A0A0S2HXP4_9BACT|nr:SGNH/GDSL hydrolase family protein [Salinivirga cyanobacteriivorans]ALO14572.1 GDSL-like Lipase/Acylhydrolase [Salinivirga cyanobacteriivorans]